MGVLGRSLPCWWGNVYYRSASRLVSPCFSAFISGLLRDPLQRKAERGSLGIARREILQIPQTTAALGKTALLV